MKEFKVSKYSLAFTYFIMAIFILAVLIMSPIIYASREDTGGKVFFFFWSIFVLFGAYRYLRMPYLISLKSETEQIIFKSLVTKKEVDIKEIRMIKTTPINSAFITFKLKSGRMTLLNSIDGLHELINEIKRVNPELETKGC